MASTSVPNPLEQLFGVDDCASLENGEVFQQRDDANNDDDNLNDLTRPAVDRQALNQIEDQDDHQKGDQNTDQQ